MKALLKVHTSLSERYLAICANCHDYRQFFGTEETARKDAEHHGWCFEPASIELLYCPKCWYGSPEQNKGIAHADNTTERQESRDPQHG